MSRAGVKPMTAIQSATLNVAKTFRKDKDFGSVEPGKIADLSIIEARSAHGHLGNAKREDGGDGRQAHRYRAHQLQESDSLLLCYQSLPMDLEVTPNATVQGAGPITLKVRGNGMWPFHAFMLKREFGGIFNFNAPSCRRATSPSPSSKPASPPSSSPMPAPYTITVKGEGEILPNPPRASRGWFRD